MVKPIYSSEEESKYLVLTAAFYSETNFWKYSNIVPYQKKFCARPSRFLLEFVQKEQCERGRVIFFFPLTLGARKMLTEKKKKKKSSHLALQFSTNMARK